MGGGLQAIEKREDLGLNRDVERRHGFVADKKCGPEGHGAGNRRALKLPARHDAGELLRIVFGKTHGAKDLERLRACVFVRKMKVHLKGLGDLV